MQGHLCGATDFQLLDSVQTSAFPFRTEISLKPLIDFWTRAADSATAKGALARIVAEEIKKAPELLRTITSSSVIAQHQDTPSPLQATLLSALPDSHGPARPGSHEG